MLPMGPTQRIAQQQIKRRLKQQHGIVLTVCATTALVRGRKRDLVDGCGDIGEVYWVIRGRLHLIEGVGCIKADRVTAILLPKGLYTMSPSCLLNDAHVQHAAKCYPDLSRPILHRLYHTR